MTISLMTAENNAQTAQTGSAPIALFTYLAIRTSPQDEVRIHFGSISRVGEQRGPDALELETQPQSLFQIRKSEKSISSALLDFSYVICQAISSMYPKEVGMRPERLREIERQHGIRRSRDPWSSDDEFADSDLRSQGASGRESRRARIFGPGELRLALLRLLADTPGHGYELIKTIEGLTGGAYSPSAGSVYPTLQLLVDEGAITERQDDDGTRKTYAVAAPGKSELAEREAEARSLMDRLAGLAEERRPESTLQVNRAMENLRNALRIRSRRGALEGEALHAIIDILDEAARRIERM